MAIGSSVALPTCVRADSGDWHRRDHNTWRPGHHEHDSDDYYDPGHRDSPSAPAYAYRYYQNVPSNAEGMINRRNPNFRWTCDSEGHHCHWARP